MDTTAPYIEERYAAIVKNIIMSTTVGHMDGVLEWINRCDSEYGKAWLPYHTKLVAFYNQKVEDLRLSTFEDRIFIDHDTEYVSSSLGVSEERMLDFNRVICDEIYPQNGVEKIIKISRLIEVISKEARTLQELVLASIMLGSAKETLQKISGKLKHVGEGPIDDAAIQDILNGEE